MRPALSTRGPWVPTAILLGAVAALMPACHAHVQTWSIDAPVAETQRTTAQGDVIGGHGRWGGDAWLGIPFAAPPVGDLRWRAPRPPASWSGQRQTLTFGPGCPQFASAMGGAAGPEGTLAGNEDCLYLNVWTPTFTPDALPRGADRLPVMFWIHGGGNSIGRASTYDGSRLADEHHVIVVTTQYRLGPLGWFRQKSLRAGADPLEASGDFGTLDLVRGLQWVRENIAAFGGDPGNVTIFGESAGGQDVYSLLVSPPARGLFQRAIVESGGLSRTTTADAENFTDDKRPGHKNSSDEVIVRQLVADGLAPDRAAAKARLASMGDAALATYLRGWSLPRLFGQYAADRKLGMLDMPLVINDGAVLPEDWLGHLARADGWNKVPVLVGTNHDEAKLFLFFNPLLIHRVLGIFPRFIHEQAYEAAASAMSRTWKATGADAPATAMHQSGESNVFVYRFDWHGEPTVAGADLSKMLGAAHAMEIPFVFGTFDFGRLTSMLFDEEGAPERRALSDAMMTYWTQFARTGSPNGRQPTDPPHWPAWSDAPRFLVLDVADDGGIRPSSDLRSMAQIIADVDADVRLPTQREKCALFHELAGWTHGLDKEAYVHVGKHGCVEYPFDEFPWGLR